MGGCPESNASALVGLCCYACIERFGQFTVGEEVAQKERLYELSSTSLHPRKLSMQTAYFIVIALINSALLSNYGMWSGSCVHIQKQSKYISSEIHYIHC